MAMIGGEPSFSHCVPRLELHRRISERLLIVESRKELVQSFKTFLVSRQIVRMVARREFTFAPYVGTGRGIR